MKMQRALPVDGWPRMVSEVTARLGPGGYFFFAT